MATNIENVMKKIKSSKQEIGKSIREHLNTGKRSDDKNKLSEEDLRQYEQLVMMKKYPYLDIKELELKYSPSRDKNIRQSLNFASGSNIGVDPSLREAIDEGPCVEINNRGLSGFAIPLKLSKLDNIPEQHKNVKIPQFKDLKNVKMSLNNFRIVPDVGTS